MRENKRRNAGAHYASAAKPASRAYSRGNGPVAPQQYLEHSKSNKPRLRGWEKALITILVLVVLSGCTAFGYMMHLNKSIHLEDKDDLARTTKVLEEPLEMNDSFYALVIGSDSRTKSLKGTRSDVLILCHVDPEQHLVNMVSIPRDTAVNIPGHGVCKINAAMAYGGVSGTIDCVSKFAGVPISHFAVVRFDNVVDIVDSLGGVEVNVPQGFTTHYSGVTVPQGVNNLNGQQALAFARERYHVTGGDFARAQAQRTVMKAVVNKVLNASVSDMPGLVESLAKGVATDLDMADIVALAVQFKDGGITFNSATCPSYCKNMNGASYVCTMLDQWKEMMRRLDANIDPSDTTATIPVDAKISPQVGVPTNSASPQQYAEGDATQSVLPEDYGLNV